MKHLLQLDVLIQDNPQPIGAPSAYPALERMLGVGGDLTVHPVSASSWLLQAFGASCVAPYSALGDGLPAQSGYWLRADPVYLHLMRDRIILPQPAVDEIDTDEAQTLVQTLNAHFTELQFFAPHPRRWYVHVNTPQHLITHDPERVVGRDIRQHMPQGVDGQAWISRLNEAQMLLHAHAVNEQREAIGKLPVNGLWLWGGGSWEPPNQQPYGQCWGDNALLNGLVGNPSLLPDSMECVLSCQEARQLLVLDAQPGSTLLEGRYLERLFQALRRGCFQRLRLLVAREGQMLECVIQRWDGWKLWRGKKDLMTVFFQRGH